MEENTEKRVDLTLFSEKIQELKDRIASVIDMPKTFLKSIMILHCWQI